MVEGEAGPAPSPAAPKPGRSLLALSDAPDLETGFARVARNLYRGWLSAGVFDRIQVFGIGYEGFPYDLPGIVQIPAATMLDPRWFSPFNLRRFATQAKAYRDELAGRGEELSLFVVQDPAHLCDLAEAFLAVGFEPAREGVKFLAYAPADADQPAEIKRRLSAAVGRVYSEVIAYCETGRRWLGLPDGARAVPHGVDRTAFCPDAVEDGLRKDEIPGWRRCRRLDRRKGYLGNLAEEPARLLVSVCRPDPRKGIFHSLLVLKELLKLGSYRLYLHMPAVDPVVRIARWAAVSAGSDALTTPDRLAAAAVAAASVIFRAPLDCSMVAFAEDAIVLKAQDEVRDPDEVVADLLRLRGFGVTDLGLALRTAAAQLARSTAGRRITLLMSDCRVTAGGDALVHAAGTHEVAVLAPNGDTADAEAFAFAVPMPTAAELAVLAVGGVALFVLARRRAVVALAMAVALTPLELAARRHGAPKGVLRVTALDVGQGDSTLVDLPDGRLMLIDGGGFVGSPVDPGQSVILPLLRARRRSRVDVIVLSHPHPDHFGGLGSVLREIPVGELWDTGQGEREGAGPTYARLLQTARARHVALKRPTELCGTRTFGGAHLEVLSPCPTFSPGKHANDNSFVLRLGYGSRHVLLMGDAEADEESALLGGGVDVSADLLKVGHHGSRTSTSAALLSRVKPSVATISCGVRNRFGHPHAVTLQKLSAARVTLYRTDRRGGVVWRTDGDAAHVETERKSR